MTFRYGATIVLALALGVSAPALGGGAWAREAPTVSRQEVAGWLRGNGLAANIHNDSNGLSIISSTTEGVNFDIYFFGCDGERCRSIQFAAGWPPGASYTLDKVNLWNRDNRYLRVYISAKSDLFAEYDVEVDDPAAPQFNRALGKFGESIGDFKTYFGL